MQAQQDLDGGHNGAGVERDLGQWDDADAQAHEQGQGARVARLNEDVGRNLVAHIIAEHEQAGYGSDGVEDVLGGGC